MNARVSGAVRWFVAIAFAVSAFALVSVLGPRSVSAQREEPTVDDILNRYIRALGGKAAIQKLTSRFGKGTITITGAGTEGTVQAWLLAPNKLLVVTEFPGMGTFRQGFDGTLAWSEENDSSLHVVTGPELEDLRRTADFYRALHMKDVYPGLTLKDEEQLNGANVWVLETTLAPWTYRMYFDAHTGLMSRFDMERPSESGGKTLIVLSPEDYRPVGGVMVPFTLRESSPAVSWVEKFTEITPNAVTDGSIFNRPPLPAPPK
jgi:hypothetical protein